jgi:hypothetical protein
MHFCIAAMHMIHKTRFKFIFNNLNLRSYIAHNFVNNSAIGFTKSSPILSCSDAHCAFAVTLFRVIQKNRSMIMSMRLISTTVLALTMLTPLAFAKPVVPQAPDATNCLQRDIGQKADCIDPTAGGVDLVGAVTVNSTNGAHGDSDHSDNRSGTYTIIYKADPFLTINNNPK